jgi:hypothetical protein
MMPDRRHAEIAHRTDGRVRVRIPGRQGDGRYFAQAAAHVATLDGVVAVRPSPYSASLVIHHDSRFELAHVSDALAAGPALEAEKIVPSTAPAMSPKSAPPGRFVGSALLVFEIAEVGLALSSGGSLVPLARFAVQRLVRAALRSALPA